MKNFTLICSFLLFITATYAVNRSYYFKHLKVEDGLAQNTVTTILQDNKGFMWFGTKNGLNRYDGYKFKTFRNDPSDSTSLGNDFIHSLYEDKQGNIWVGTDMGLYIYDTRMEVFRHFDLQTPDGSEITKEVHCIVPDGRGNLWIGVYWVGLFRYDTSTGELSVVAYADGTTQGLNSNGIWSICVDADNVLWIGTVGGGLNMYNPSNGEIRFFNMVHTDGRNDVIEVQEEGPNSLLLGTTDDGVWRFDKITQSMTPFINNAEGSMYVRKIMKSDNDNLWLGTESGLYIYNIPSGTLKNTRLDFSNRYSLSSNAVYSLYMDRENGIWSGTYFGGVNYLSSDHNYFDKYFPTNVSGALSGNAVREFQEDVSGNLWIGTEDNGLNYFNPRTGEFRSYSPSNSDLSYHNIHGLLLDGDKLFIGYFMNGMDVYDLKTHRVRNYKSAGTETSLSDNNVFAIRRDCRGNYWVGTIAGLNLFDPDKGVFTRVHEVGTHAFIYDLLEDSRGIIWVATYYTGIFSYNPRSGVWTNYVHIPGQPTSLGYDKTISLSEDSRGNIWIATEGGGVSVYSPGEDKFRTYTVLDGLPNNVVHKVLEDEYAKMWISTNNGLAVLDPKNEEFQIYTHNKGLMSNQFNYKSGIKTADGRLYFGSIQGMVGFDPLRQFPNRTAPPVVLTRFDLFNREVTPSDEDSPLDSSVIYGQGVTLTHRQSSFSFEFAALSYNASEMNRYAYRLEGLEEDWTYICGNQRVSYSNVPHGSYVFRVRGANSDGLWNNEGASMPIRIRPPFRLSVVGVVLESLLGISLVLVVVLFYHHRIKQKHRRIVEELKAAEDIALQKAKMSFFTNMTHEIRTPLSLIRAPFEQISKIDTDNEDVAENLKIMGSNINRLLNLTNELLDFSKVENRGFNLRMRVADIGELVNYTLIGFGQIIRDKELELELALPRNPIVTYADAEILSKIFINLMSNATKFAERRITVALADNTPDERFFRFTIANDGEQITPENREDVFKAFFQERRADASAGTGLGLPLVKQLTELHGGRIYIDPVAESENRFVVEIPKADESAGQGALPESDEEPYCGDAEQPHIIIAEDESTMRQFLSKSLSKSYRITACADGQEVLDVLKRQPADLILTDLVMPRMDGLHLCNILKTELEYCHIPVIILTARANIESEIEVLDSGADAYIEKPFSLEHLQTRIANLLAKVRRLREAFRNNPDTPAGSIATNATDEAFIRRVTDIILEHNEDDGFSIDQLAEVMNISRSSLYRKIKGVSQLPPNEFIRLCKLKRAADLLNEGTFRINEICYLVGFNSPSYFAKCFQKQFGVSPKDYAKRRR